MRHPVNLEEAEELFGIERVRRPRKKERKERKSNRVGMRREWCLDCNKWGYRTEEAARIVIERMLANGSLSGPTAFSFKPYLCVHGWWHTGHDIQSRRLFDPELDRSIRQRAQAIATLSEFWGRDKGAEGMAV